MVGRESTFPSGAADLILVDDRGQVCLVEVKKEGNPDVRRVVAQLLDYAAGLWGKTLLEFEQDVFLPYAEKAGGLPISLRVLLADKFGRRVDEGATDDTELQPSVEEIETALGENLLSGRFVLVVAAPVIPEPVRRVLDYMNAQGLRLYGLEVSYFNGPAECFVPRLAVQPPPLDQIATKGSRVWDQAAILQQLRLKKGEEAAEVAEAIFDWADAQGLRRWYGAGHVDGSCYIGEEDERGYLRLFAVWTYGHITLQFGELASGKHPSFEPADKRKELQRRLNEIPGISIPDERIDKYPSIAPAALADPDRRSQFLRVMEWAISQMKETSIESAST